MIEAHEAGAAPNFELYGLGLEHKHVPEIMAYGRLTMRPIFVPSVGHYAQGMLVSVPLHLDSLPGKPTGADLRAALSQHYAGSEFVSVVTAEAMQAEGGKLEPEALNDTNRLELRVMANENRRQAVIVARLDNLGKGASGAAVQNMRLMMGCELNANAEIAAIRAATQAYLDGLTTETRTRSPASSCRPQHSRNPSTGSSK